MTNLVMLIVCLAAGMALRSARRVPDNAHLAMNGFIIHVALPALILCNIHGLRITPALLVPVSMPWLLFALSAAAFALLARAVKLPRGTTGALIMTAGLANTSFIGLPMIETFYGPADLSTGILIDQLGTYLVLSTAGITIACMFSSGVASWREIGRRIVTFPPLIALVLAFVLMPVAYPAWLTGALHRLGDTLAPLALVSVGLQLRLEQLPGYRLLLGYGLGFKLILGPLVLALVYVGVLEQHGETMQVTLFEAAMAPQIGGAIVAMQYGLNPTLITLMVGIGVALSFITLPVWYLGLAAL
jgi:predicted permease